MRRARARQRRAAAGWAAALAGLLLCGPGVPPAGAQADVQAGVQADAQAAPAPDAPPRFSVEMPPGPLQLGQRFELVVHGPLAPDARLDLGTLPSGVVAGPGRLVPEPDGPVLHQELRATREGPVALTELSVESAGRRDALPHVNLEVVLDLPAGRVPRVAEALPVPEVPGWPRWMEWLAAGVALALVAAILLLRRWRAAAPEDLPEPRAPEETAAEALARLRAQLPRTADDVPPFLTEVSAVLRTYIEDSFGVRAPESTTEEFLARVAGRHDALATRRPELEAFLTRCDLVKFARHRPEPGFVLPLLDTAEGFVAATAREPQAPGAAA